MSPAPSDPALAERVDAVRPVIERHAAEHERDGRLSKPVVDVLREQGLFALATPQAYGGLEADPLAILEVIEALAAIDSATAWNVNQCMGGSTLAAKLDATGLGRLFPAGASAPPVFAGAAYPPCAATPVEGGFEVSGTVRFLSGCHQADWLFVFGIPPVAEGERPAPHLMFVPRASAELLDTWHVMGMRGTGSSDIRLDRVVVPDAMTASMVAPRPPEPAFTGVLYQMFPWVVLVGEAVASIGIAQAALDVVTELSHKKVPANATATIDGRELVQANVGRARALIESARAVIRATMADALATVSSGSPITLDQKVSLQLAMCTGAENSAKAVDLLYDVSGSTGFLEGGGIERHFRDVHVLTQHTTKSSPRYASAGKVMLGVPSDIALLAQ